MLNCKLNKKTIEVDFCVIGGGMAGISAAITAARCGVKTAIIHERPVFGGNASGEIRMWICGVKDFDFKETGLVEELSLENYYYNPDKRYPLWDALIYGKVNEEQNLQTYLNCTCIDAQIENGKITSITGYQMTTQSFIEVKAKYYADCSGDSILAPLTNAEYMYGRESVSDYGETIMKTHSARDMKTMGNSCLIQARKTDRKIKFTAPAWAEKVSVDKLKRLGVNLSSAGENFWYIEIGGIDDVINHAENYNKRLISIVLGIWDTIKNSGEFNADNFDIDFIGFLGAKRESRRMKGDYVMTANDIMNRTEFKDEVAYGGWPLDDHNPEGFDGNYANYTISVKPYGIPYRCLYSKNIDNLYFAGRNISLTHMASSSARVMCTCSILGQAVGAACSVASKYNISPREAGEKYIDDIQQLLMKLDCFLPNTRRRVRKENLTAKKNVSDLLCNGKERNICGEENRVVINNGDEIVYDFVKGVSVSEIKIVFDSDLQRTTFGHIDEVERHHIMRCNVLDDSPTMYMPKTLAKDFILTIMHENNREELFEFHNNLKRNILIPITGKIKCMRLKVLSNWGDTHTTPLFDFEII